MIPVQILTFCFSRAAAFSPPDRRLRMTAREVHVHRVLRRIPTDSIAAEQAHVPLAPGAHDIGAIVECSFESDAHAQLPRALATLRGAGELLFGFEMLRNAPIAATPEAAAGGFRRWMLLRRAAAGHETFRQAWSGRHARLVRALPRVDGYFQDLVTSRFDARGEPLAYEALPVDGVAQLCYADEVAMTASYASDARAPLREDGRALHSGNVTYLVEGERV
jgi:hypothetical protein